MRFLTLAASAHMLVAHLDGVSTISKCGQILLAKYWICLVNVVVSPWKLSKLSSVWRRSFAEACQHAIMNNKS